MVEQSDQIRWTCPNRCRRLPYGLQVQALPVVRCQQMKNQWLKCVIFMTCSTTTGERALSVTGLRVPVPSMMDRALTIQVYKHTLKHCEGGTAWHLLDLDFCVWELRFIGRMSAGYRLSHVSDYAPCIILCYFTHIFIQAST
jgi:hypothetical protein